MCVVCVYVCAVLCLCGGCVCGVCVSNVVLGIKLGFVHERQTHPLLLSYVLDLLFFFMLLIYIFTEQKTFSFYYAITTNGNHA